MSWPHAGPGRVRGSITKIRRDLRDWARKDGKQAFENLKQLALHGENDFVRLAATKEWLDRGFGKPVAADEGRGVPTTVNVITGVDFDRDGPGHSVPPKVLLPDGRNPFSPPPALPACRPMGRAPVVDPPSAVTITERPSEKCVDKSGG